MLELHLKQLGFTYSACGPFTKHRERIQEFRETRHLKLLYRNKVKKIIRVYDRTRYLALFGTEKYDSIYNRIRYLKGVTIGITYVISYNYARINNQLLHMILCL